jgi:hypothetical protein
MMDSAGVNNHVWVASGVINQIRVSALATAPAIPDFIDIWDFRDITGRPCNDQNTYLLDALANVQGLERGLIAATGIFECIADAAGADSRAAFVAANCTRRFSYNPVFNNWWEVLDAPVPCPHGMIVNVGNTTGAGQTIVNINYTPWVLGAIRRKQATQAVSPRVEQQPVL